MKQLIEVIVKGICGFCLMLTFAANAANVLITTTYETNSGAIGIENNVYNMFNSIAGNAVTDQRRILGNHTSVTGNGVPSFAGYDVVVVLATYYGLEADEQTALINAINNKESGTFVVILDGCCGNGPGNSPYNSETTANILNLVMSPTPSPSIVAGSLYRVAMNYTLSASLAYAYSFSGLPSIRGTWYRPVVNLPVENALYYDSSSRPTGVFLPEADTNGACVFSLMDASPFASGYIAGNSAFAQVIQDAILDPVGSCHRSKAGNAVVAEDDSYTVKPGLIIEKDTANNSIVVLDNDSELLAEGLLLEASGTDTVSANGGVVSISGSTLLYTPVTGFEGVDTFTYEVCVPSGACDAAVVTILIVTPPYAVYDNVSTPLNTAVTISVLDNDIISTVTPATINTFTQATNGSVVQSGDSFVYTPADGFSGQDTFTYTICDTNSVCSTATVTITIGVVVTTTVKSIPALSWYGVLLIIMGIFAGLGVDYYKKSTNKAI